MPANERNHPSVGRLIAGAGLLTVMCAVAGTGLAGTAGAVQLVGYGSSQSQPHLSPGAVAAPGAGVAATPFSISGKVTGLYPGKTLALVLTVTNPNKSSITVASITTAVSSVSTACAASNLKVTSFSGSLTVGALASAKVTVHATLLHSAPDACQGGMFDLHYSGAGTGG